MVVQLKVCKWAAVSQKVKMAYYIVNNAADIQGSETTVLNEMHRQFMQAAMDDTAKRLIDEGKNCFINSIDLLMHCSMLQRHILASLRLDLLVCRHSKNMHSIAHTSTVLIILLPLVTNMSTTYAGATHEMAFKHAIVAEVLQILEAKENGIFVKDSKGHLVFTAATQAGADALSQIPYVQFGIHSKFSMHLMPDLKLASHTMDYSIVGGRVSAASYTAGTMLHHLQELARRAKSKGLALANAGMIATPATEIQLYLYNDSDQAINVDTVDLNNIANVTFTPGGQSMASMPQGFVQDKANSAGGLLPTWKATTQLTSVLMLTASSSKPALELDGQPHFYSAGRKSIVGDTMLKAHAKQNSITASVACLAMAKGAKPTPAELQGWHGDMTNLKFSLTEAWKSMPAQTVPEVPVEADDSPDIMGDLLPGPSPESERQGLRRARDEVSSKREYTCEQHPQQYSHSCRKHTNHSDYLINPALPVLPTSHWHMNIIHSAQTTSFGTSVPSNRLYHLCTSLKYCNSGLYKYRPSILKPGRDWHWRDILREQGQQVQTLVGQMLKLPCPKALWSPTIKPLTSQAVTMTKGHQWTMHQLTKAETSLCHQLTQTMWYSRDGEPCPTCIHANEHMTPHGMSNMHTALGNQSKMYDASMLVAAKPVPTVNMDLRKCTSVTSTHTSVNNYMLTPRRPMDAIKWHSTHVAVAVSHLYASLESMIVPMLPSLKPNFVWIFADDLYIVHNGLLPSIEVPVHWRQHRHDTHVSGEVVQTVQTLTNDLRMQTRSLAKWEPIGKIVLQTCKHISLALIGLLLPCAVTVTIQALRLTALTSITLLHFTTQLTTAVARKRMQTARH